MAKPLLVIAGPTAGGKSALALELASRHDGVLVSADSRQIYREFDIGTAKPTLEELSSVPHRLIDVADPTETVTLAQYQRMAMEAIAEVHAEGKLPILVGGTGLYIRSVVGGLVIPEVPPDQALRDRLKLLPNLHERLLAVDPEAAARIHPNDTVRLVRALEVYHLTGKTITELQRRQPCPYEALYLALEWEREELYERIDARVHVMVEMGLIKEVERLVGAYGHDLPLLRTLGYGETCGFLKGELSQEEAIALIQKNTRNYAKRQMTWFRHEPEVRWIPVGKHATMPELISRAEALMQTVF